MEKVYCSKMSGGTAGYDRLQTIWKSTFRKYRHAIATEVSEKSNSVLIDYHALLGDIAKVAHQEV